MIKISRNSLNKLISGLLAGLIGLQPLIQVLLLFTFMASSIFPAPKNAYAHNMTNNWSFESPSGAGLSPGSWTKTTTSDTAGGYEVAGLTTNTVAYTGSQSVRGRWTGSGANQAWNITLFQKFTASANVKAKLRGRYRREQFSGAGETVTAVLELASGAAADGTGGSILANPINWSGANQTVNDGNFNVAPGSGTWSADVNLGAGTGYTIRTRWSGTGMDAGDYGGAWFDDIELSMAPAGLAASAPVNTTNVTLSWDVSTPGSGAAALHATNPYKIYRDGAFLSNNSSTTYTDNSTQGNTSYQYYVTDVDTNSIESPSSSVVTQLTRPDMAGTPSYSTPNETDVTVSWSAPTGGSPTYAVERAPDSAGSPGSWTQITTVSGSTEYNDPSLSAGTTYWYRVRGANVTGYGAYSGQSSVTTANPPGGGTLDIGSPGSPPGEGSENTLRRGVNQQWVERFVLTASGGDVTFDSLRVRRDPGSDLPVSEIGTVRLYRDNGDGNFSSSSDTLLGTTTAIDQWISVSSNNVVTTVSASAQRTFHVVADINATSTNYSKILRTTIDSTDIQSDASVYNGTANSNDNKVYGGDISASSSSTGGSVERSVETTAMTLTITPTQGWSSLNAIRVYLTGSAQSTDLDYLKIFEGSNELGVWNTPAGGQSQEINLIPDQNFNTGYSLSIKLKTSNAALNDRTFGVIVTSAAAMTADVPTGGISGSFPLTGQIYTVASLPSAPASLTATAVSSSQIDLSWADNSDNETGFKIERKTGLTGSYTNIATVAANSTTHNDTSGLDPSTEYYYRVRAYNTIGNSNYSNEANDTTDPPPSSTQLSVGEGSGISSGQNLSPGQQYALMHTSLTASNGTVTASYVTVRLTGSYTSAEMVTVAVHRDDAPVGTFGSEDDLISATQANPSPNTPYQLNLSALQAIASGNSMKMWITGKVTAQPTPVDGRTIRVKIDEIGTSPLVSTSYSPDPLLSQNTHTIDAPTLQVGSPNSQASANIYRAGLSVAVEKIVLTASGSITITSVAVNNVGTLGAQYIDFTRLQRESDNQQLGALAGTDGWVNLSTPLIVTSGTSLSARTLLVKMDIATSAPSNNTVITQVNSSDINADTNSQNISGSAQSNTMTIKGAPVTVARPSSGSGNVQRNTTTTAMSLSFNPTAGWSKITDLRLTLSSSTVQSGDLGSIAIKRLGTTLAAWSDPVGGQSQTMALSPNQDISTNEARTVSVEVNVASAAEDNDSFQVQLTSAAAVFSDAEQINGSFPLQSGVLVIPAPVPGNLGVSQGTGVSSNLQIPVGSQDNVMHVRLTAASGDVDVNSLRVTLSSAYSTGEILTMAVHRDAGVVGTWEPGTDAVKTSVLNNPVANTGYTMSYASSDSISSGSDAYYWIRVGVTTAVAANGKTIRGAVNAVGSNAGSTAGAPLTSSYTHTLTAPNLTVGNIAQAPSTVYKGNSWKVMQRLSMTAANGNVTLTSIRADYSGTTIADATPALYEDVDKDGVYDGGEPSQQGSWSGNYADFTGLNKTITSGVSVQYGIALNISETATNNNIASTLVNNQSYIGITGGTVNAFAAYASGNSTIKGAPVNLQNGSGNPAGSTVNRDDQVVMQHFALSHAAGAANAETIRLQLTASNGFQTGNVAWLKLYWDQDGDAVLDGGEPQLGTTWNQPPSGAFNIFTASFNMTTGYSTHNFLVHALVSSSAVDGAKFRTRIENTAAISSDAQTVTLTGSPIAGGVFTVQTVNLTMGNQTTGNGTVYKGESDRLIERIILTASGGTATVSSLRVDNIGTAGSSDYSNIKIKVGGTEVSSGSFGASLPISPAQAITAGTSKTFEIYANVPVGATKNNTFQAQVQNGYVGSDASGVSGGPRTGSTWTIQSGNVAASNGSYGPGSTINQGATKVIQQVKLDASVGGVTVNSLKIQVTAANGLLQNDISSISLYTDNNNDGSISGETQLGSTWSNPTLNNSNTFSFGASVQNIASGASQNLLVQSTITSTAVENGTFRTRIAANADIGSDAQGASGAPVNATAQTVQAVTSPPGDAPTGLTVVSKVFPTFALSWVAAANATSYQIQRNTSADANGAYTYPSEPSVTDTEINVPSVGNWYFRVRGKNGSGEGPWSSWATAGSVNFTVYQSTTQAIQSANGKVKIEFLGSGYSPTWSVQQTTAPSDVNGLAPGTRFVTPYVEFTGTGPESVNSSRPVRLTLGGLTIQGGGYHLILWSWSGTKWTRDGSNFFYNYKTGYLEADVTSFSGKVGGYGNQYTDGPSGPHGNYTGTAAKCKDCHAVHDAFAPDGYKLTRRVTTGFGSTMGGPVRTCLFCHRYDDGLIDDARVYRFRDSSLASHRLGATSIPDSDSTTYGGANAEWASLTKGDTTGLDCLDCHRAAPHGAGWEAGTALLVVTTSYGYFNMCGQCHNRNKFRASVTSAVTFNQHTHPLITDATEKLGGRTVVSSSVTQVMCRNCHSVARNSPSPTRSLNPEGDFPHTSRSSRFLLQETNTVSASSLDKLCLTCHRWDGASGVGLSF